MTRYSSVKSQDVNMQTKKNTRNCFRHSVDNRSNNGKHSEDYKGVSVKNYVVFLPFHCHRMSGETIRTFQGLRHRHNLKGHKTSSISTQKKNNNDNMDTVMRNKQNYIKRILTKLSVRWIYATNYGEVNCFLPNYFSHYICCYYLKYSTKGIHGKKKVFENDTQIA